MAYVDLLFLLFGRLALDHSQSTLPPRNLSAQTTKGQLAQQFSREVSHRSAMGPDGESTSSSRENDPSSTRSQGYDHSQGEGHSISG